MVGHGGSSAGSYLADPTSPIPSHCASIVVTSTLRVTLTHNGACQYQVFHGLVYIHQNPTRVAESLYKEIL